MTFLSSSSVILLVAVVTLLIQWAYKIYVLDRRLRVFKGPTSVRFLHFWHAKAVVTGKYNEAYHYACSQYGSVARVGPNELVTNSPDLIMRMSSPRAGYTKARWFYQATRLEPGKDHIFSQTDEKLHKDRRAQMAAGYALRGNNALEDTIDHHVSNLAKLIRTKYCSASSEYKPMDLAQKLHFLAVDVITDVGFGAPLGDLTKDEDVFDHIKSTGETIVYLSIAAGLGLMPYIMTPAIHRLLVSEKDEGGLGKLLATVRKLVKDRAFHKGPTRSAMVDVFMKNGLSEADCVTEAVLQVIAGTDAVATVIRSTMLLLIANPRVYRKLQDAVDAFNKTDRQGTGIPDAEVAQMPYLQAVIKEGMRAFPPATDPATKRSPPNGDTVEVDGQKLYIPGNVDITTSAWSLLRRKDIFGPDVEVFRPERWTEASGEVLNRMNRTADLVFGYGKYQCLGMTLARMEINKAIFELFSNFDFTLINPSKPWNSVNHMGVWIQSDLWVHVEDRVGSELSAGSLTI